MARNKLNDAAEKAKVLRALAHQVHRKQPLEDVLMEYIEDNLRHNRNREFRPAEQALREDGPVAALRALELIGEETSRVFGCVIEAGDHRVLSKALDSLAEYQENPDGF